jgi:hypothetical protein
MRSLRTFHVHVQVEVADLLRLPATGGRWQESSFLRKRQNNATSTLCGRARRDICGAA